MVPFDRNSIVFILTLIYLTNQSVGVPDDVQNYYYTQVGPGNVPEPNSSRCYIKDGKNYGCFNLNYPWTGDSRPVSLFPNDIEEIQPQYLLLTRGNPNTPITLNLTNLNNDKSNLYEQKPMYIVTHGYMEGGSIDWIHNIGRAFLAQEDCNVIIVDWHKGSGPPYTQAVANIRLMGAMTAHFLADVAKYTRDKNLEHVHAIGHSLGAHLSGYIGYTLKQKFNLTLGRITGLDPAEPHFGKTEAPVRLDRSAATYVDVIHTDASQFIRGGLGMLESIGHVDYYPNGGTDQPGCTKGVMQYIKDANGSFFNGVKKYLGCNHVRSHEFFLESITPNPKCRFVSVSCPSFQDLRSGRCFGCGRSRENCMPFGHHGRKYYEKYLRDKWEHTSRVQYLITGELKPFCKHHYRIVVQVSNSNMSKLHGGEIGQLFFTMHSTTDGRGHKTPPVGFISGYHEPGGMYMGVVGAESVPHLRAVEIEWRFNSSLFNPLTWRILSTPKIYLKKVTVEALEIEESVTVCPKWQKPLDNGVSQMMIPSYC